MRIKPIPGKASKKASQEKRFRVMIDPGHGGTDPGARGLSGSIEKEINRDVAHQVAHHLKAHNIDVLLSRFGDESMTIMDRVEKAAHFGADLVVSIHANSAPIKSREGFEVYCLDRSKYASPAVHKKLYGAKNPREEVVLKKIDQIMVDTIGESERFADCLIKNVTESMKHKYQCVQRGKRVGVYRTLACNSMPAVIVELGYLTHHDEVKRLMDPGYQGVMARSIAQAIVEFAQ